ncbi:MAG: hypothetical protein HY650_16835 [Acidobacteria bacterium]|nr:hypothetical protein [Acidobacteriota bacterium]
MAAPGTERSAPEYWLGPAGQEKLPELLKYRPAVFFSCLLDFRDVRAELVDSMDHICAAWLPADDLAVDWTEPACRNLQDDMLETAPRAGILPDPGPVDLSTDRLYGIEEDLVRHLVRTAYRAIYFNLNFRLYSRLHESRHDFLQRLREEANLRGQQSLKELARQVKLKLGQVREGALPRGLREEKLEYLQQESRRITSLVESRLSEAIFNSRLPASHDLFHVETSIEPPPELKALETDLNRIEREAYDRLRRLIQDSRQEAEEISEYQVRIQPNNVHILRRGLLWIPAPL